MLNHLIDITEAKRKKKKSTKKGSSLSDWAKEIAKKYGITVKWHKFNSQYEFTFGNIRVGSMSPAGMVNHRKADDTGKGLIEDNFKWSGAPKSK